MNNIESITSKITADAKEQAQQRIEQAKQEAQQILQDYQAQAQQVTQQAQQQAQKEAALIAERVESQSGLVRRNMMLQYKRDVMEQAFCKALEQLCAQDCDKQVELLASAATKYLSSDAQIILNESDKTKFGSKLIEEISAKLNTENKPYRVSLSEINGSMQGGMILAQGNIETNLSYEILVKNVRDELEAQVAQILTQC